MTFDAWYHGLIGFAFGWFAAAFVIFNGWKIAARISSLVFRLTTRCDYCGRLYLRCWKKNTCEGRMRC